MKISVATQVKATLDLVWSSWITPADIVCWNFASSDWCCPAATISLQEGGRFNYRMEATDGSMGFDFEGTFTKVVPQQCIEYVMDDERKVTITFDVMSDGVKVTEEFDAEDVHSGEQQQQGWQSILNQFKQHVESK